MTNILKPELIWIDGRCYRFLENSEWKNFHDTSTNLEEMDFDHSDYDEEDSNNEIELEPYRSSRYKHTFHVAKPFFPFIIGSKNAVRKRLENETKTNIQIPRPGEDGDIVIIGFYEKGIIKARRRIDLIIASTRKKMQFTHFLSIPLNTLNIMMQFNEFKTKVLEQFGSTSRAVEPNIFQTPAKLHLTLGILTLLDDAERNRAIEALNHCEEHIVKHIIQKCGQIHIRLKGIEIMNDDPSEAKVLYAKVVPNKALQVLADEIVNYYSDIGLLRKEREFVKLHLTFMNIHYKLKDEEVNSKSDRTFDATEILKAYENTAFGEITLKEIHLSQRHAYGSDGYFQTTAKINISEDL